MILSAPWLLLLGEMCDLVFAQACGARLFACLGIVCAVALQGLDLLRIGLGGLEVIGAQAAHAGGGDNPACARTSGLANTPEHFCAFTRGFLCAFAEAHLVQP